MQVHEGPQGLGTGNNVPLKPGHVLTNEPGYCMFSIYNRSLMVVLILVFLDYEGHWGIRIESALVVRRVQVSAYEIFGRIPPNNASRRRATSKGMCGWASSALPKSPFKQKW